MDEGPLQPEHSPLSTNSSHHAHEATAVCIAPCSPVATYAASESQEITHEIKAGKQY